MLYSSDNNIISINAYNNNYDTSLIFRISILSRIAIAVIELSLQEWKIHVYLNHRYNKKNL